MRIEACVLNMQLSRHGTRSRDSQLLSSTMNVNVSAFSCAADPVSWKRQCEADEAAWL